MTSSYDAYSCILHAERSLKPYVHASYNYSNFHFYGTLPCSVGRASPAHPRRGCWGVGGGAQSLLPRWLWGREAAFGVWTIAAGLQRGDVTAAVDQGKKKTPGGSFSDSFSLPPWIQVPSGGRKMPLNLAIAALGIFLSPANPAQPLMSHNWLLSAPNHFTEVRINF